MMDGEFIEAKELYLKAKTNIVLDVRSESEFLKGHIVGSSNLPLLDDRERKVVGTLYKQISRQEAILSGLGFVGGKMQQMVKQVLEMQKERGLLNQEVYVYCARGGMRSQSVAWLLNIAGIRAKVARGGYKKLKQWGVEMILSLENLWVVGGNTGSGKTDLLKIIESKGNQVVDLEGMACHKGSAFGALGQKPQPSGEMFGNMLVDKIIDMDREKPIWIEDESQNIGKVFMNRDFYLLLHKSPLVEVIVPLQERRERILKEYGGFSKEELWESIVRIEKRLGTDNAKVCKELIEAGNLGTVVDITLKYYDKGYGVNREKRDLGLIRTIVKREEENLENFAERILLLAESQR